MKDSWIQISTSQKDEISKYGTEPGWRYLPAESIPSVFPQDFRDKMESAVLVVAPTSTGGTYLMFNARRVDTNAAAIDQEPFGVVVHSTGPASSGMFLHHGSWAGRTTKPPLVFWDRVEESGVGNYFLSNPPEGLLSGPLSDLPDGDLNAFVRVTARIRTGVDQNT